jgi:ABC-type multidrug transport system ATPase subunit
MTNALMIEAHGLTKRFGATVALDGIDLEVPAGAILGVLGPNGAGKTTAVRILTTLSIPDGGSARVAGHDVVGEPAAVQRNIGVTAQDATLDEVLTGRENLVMITRSSPRCSGPWRSWWSSPRWPAPCIGVAQPAEPASTG